MNTNQIQYNYEDLYVHKNQFEKTASNGNYYKIHISNSPKTNIISNMFQGDYTATTIFIVRKIHKLPKIKFDGELILKHKSQSNDEKPLYISIPLKTQSGIVSKIDLLTQPNTDVDLNLNEEIYTKNASYYENNKERVLIFHNVLHVGIPFENLSTGKIIEPKENYTKVSLSPFLGKEGFVEGNVSYQDVAAYCTPIDEEDHTIMNSTDVLIPADGKVASNKTLVSQLTTATNFAIFVILALFVTLIVPNMYRTFIIFPVFHNYALSMKGLVNRLSGVDIVSSFVILGISFSFITNGIANNDASISLIGFYLFVFYVLCFARLQYDRLMNDGKDFKAELENIHNSIKTKIGNIFENNTELKDSYIEFLKLFAEKKNDINEKTISNYIRYFKEEKIDMNSIVPDIIGLSKENGIQILGDYTIEETETNGKKNINLKFNLSLLKILVFILFVAGFILFFSLTGTMNTGSLFTYLPMYLVFICAYLLTYFEYSYSNDDISIIKKLKIAFLQTANYYNKTTPQNKPNNE